MAPMKTRFLTRLTGLTDSKKGAASGPLGFGVRQPPLLLTRIFAIPTRRQNRTNYSPSPRPSPSGRGRAAFSHSNDQSAADGSTSGRGDTLSLRERAGVRGNRAGEWLWLPSVQRHVAESPGAPAQAALCRWAEQNPVNSVKVFLWAALAIMV